MFYIMNDDGSVEEVGLGDQRWFEMMDNRERLRVALYKSPEDVLVSTVFLGADHRFNRKPGDPPILWETMIFDGPLDGYQERYSSLEEAKFGHARAVKMVEESGNKSK